jgi:hypothetical protein
MHRLAQISTDFFNIISANLCICGEKSNPCNIIGQDS